jgi:hypothetical protein
MESIICPITMEPIQNGGLTCLGNIYEYDAIQDWLLNHDTDPLINLQMPTKFIRKIDIHRKDLNEVIKDAKKSLELWCPRFKSWTSIKNEFDKMLPLYKKFNHNDPKWINYSSAKKELFMQMSDDKAYESLIRDQNLIDACDIILRPSDTGKHYDFINLTDLRITERSFKSQSFFFTNFSNSCFIKCNLSRVKFIGCNLSNVKFIGCDFCGEEVCFYKSYGIVKFIVCSVEFVDKWIMTRDLNELANILKSRLLDGDHHIDSKLFCITIDAKKSNELSIS